MSARTPPPFREMSRSVDEASDRCGQTTSIHMPKALVRDRNGAEEYLLSSKTVSKLIYDSVTAVERTGPRSPSQTLGKLGNTSLRGTL